MRTYLSFIAVCCLLVTSTQAQQPRPKFTINPRTLSFGSVGVGKTKQLSVNLRVDSTAAGDVHVVCTRPLTQHFSIVGDSAFTITKGTSHVLTVEFAPTLTGTFPDSLYISHDGDTSSAKSPTKIRMSGIGIIDTFPKISVAPGFVGFGNVEVGKTVQRSFLIRNVSDTTKALTGSVTEAHTPFVIQGGGGIFTLQKGDSLRIYVNFTPTALGNVSDSIVVTSNADDLNKTKKVYLFGAGIGVDTFAHISVQPRQVNYGSVKLGNDSTRTITVRNTSSKKLTGSVGALTAGSVYTMVSGSGSFSLDSGQTQSVVVKFTPTAAGQQVDSFFVTSTNTDSANQNIRVLLLGTGVDTTTVPGSIKVSFTTKNLDFGLTTPSTQLSLPFTIKNISDSEVTLTGMIFQTRPPFSFTGQGPFTLARNESKEIVVTFSSATPGLYTDSIRITTNATDEQSQTNIIRLRAEVAGSGSVRNNIPQLRQWSVYPNPVTSTAEICVDLTGGEEAAVELFTSTGVKVMTVFDGGLLAGEHILPLNTADLAAGSYFLRISTKNGQNTLKIAVTR